MDYSLLLMLYPREANAAIIDYLQHYGWSQYAQFVFNAFRCERSLVGMPYCMDVRGSGE